MHIFGFEFLLDECKWALGCSKWQHLHLSLVALYRSYRELDLVRKTSLYSSILYNYYRVILTRWRLSNHSLAIETGRYTRPYTERPDRVCTMCNSLEDENHVIYLCPRYNDLRLHHASLLERVSSLAEFLNPAENDMKETASYIRSIETRRQELNIEW